MASPAKDYVERGISLDAELISHPSATYYARSDIAILRAGIKQGALLVVDSAVNPCDGSLVLCSIDGQFVLRYYRVLPDLHLENVETGRKERARGLDDGSAVDVFGVVTYIINDARTGEFDDNPVI
ncbi:HumD family translesion DNA polymerase [Pseudocitrobacter cyperus]|uniref:S24 family peptidase n=1 Tax=Pseudocitrobacter cyperus TaxID=3112843 RepID=A0ABV0HEU8_9ENTR